MTTNNPTMNVRAVQMAGAYASGQAAARMRAAGLTPANRPDELPEDYGAFNWAEAIGITDRAIRSIFTAGFLDEVAAIHQRHEEAERIARADEANALAKVARPGAETGER
jgi:hypothetical protein